MSEFTKPNSFYLSFLESAISCVCNGEGTNIIIFFNMTRFLLPGNKKEKLLAKTLAKLEMLSAGDVLASWRELEHNCERMLMGSHYGRLPHAPGSEVRKQGTYDS